MKHLKTYESSFGNFKFAINVKNSSKEEKNKIIEEIKKEFRIDKENQEILMGESKRKLWRDDIPWAWTFDIYPNRYPDLQCGIVTTPNWGAGVKYMEDIVTPEEFLNVGIEGIQEYIEIKTQTNKYNL